MPPVKRCPYCSQPMARRLKSRPLGTWAVYTCTNAYCKNMQRRGCPYETNTYIRPDRSRR